MHWQPTNGPQSKDPYLAWTQATAFAGHAAALDPATRIPVLVQMKPGTNLGATSLTTLLDIPGVYRAMPAGGGAQPMFCTGTVNRRDLPALEQLVDEIEFALPLAAGAVDQSPPAAAAPSGQGKVVIGVIDRDCAFLNTAFRGAWSGPGRQRSRILSFWDQGKPVNAPTWQRPAGVGYGRELDAAGIQSLIVRTENGESEDQVYRQLGHLLDSRGNVQARAHGTHVMDVAAGLCSSRVIAASAKPDQPDAAEQCDIVFVGLPDPTPADSTGASAGAFIVDAVHYIMDRAGPGAQVVINLSVGVQGGAHDGSSLIEKALADLLARTPNLHFVVAAGNGADERCSATGTLAAAGAKPPEPTPLTWRLRAHDFTDSFLELWMRGANNRAAQLVDIQVTPPIGPPSGWVPAGVSVDLMDDQNRLTFRLAHRQTSSMGRDRMALLSMAPVHGDRGFAMAGRWKIELRNRSGTQAVNFDAWIQKDEPPTGEGAPLQSYFDDFDDTRRGEGNTISNLATHPAMLVVGACLLNRGPKTFYSAGQGATASKRALRRVDVFAPADETAGAAGLYAAEVGSGRVWRMSGTSVSAPIVTRDFVNKLVAGLAYIGSAAKQQRRSAPPAQQALTAYLATLPPMSVASIAAGGAGQKRRLPAQPRALPNAALPKTKRSTTAPATAPAAAASTPSRSKGPRRTRRPPNP